MKIKLSKSQWEQIGKTAGWLEEQQKRNFRPDWMDGTEKGFTDSDKFGLPNEGLQPIHKGDKDSLANSEANPDSNIYEGTLCPKCHCKLHYILNASTPIVNQCFQCKHKWNPDNEKATIATSKDMVKTAQWRPTDLSERSDRDLGAVYSPDEEEAILLGEEENDENYPYKSGYEEGIRNKSQGTMDESLNPYSLDTNESRKKFDLWREGFRDGIEGRMPKFASSKTKLK